MSPLVVNVSPATSMVTAVLSPMASGETQARKWRHTNSYSAPLGPLQLPSPPLQRVG